MKRMILCVLALTALLIAGASGKGDENVYSGRCGENLTWTVDENALIISGTGDMDNYSYEIVYSRIVSSAPWQSIDDRIIQYILIEDGVTSIGDFAFAGMSFQPVLCIPNSVVKIGANPLLRTSGAEVILPPNHPYLAWEDGMLYGKSDKRLVYSSRWNVAANETVVVPDGVEIIDEGVFFGSTMQYVTIPESVKSIGNRAFSNCIFLKSIAIPEGVTRIGDSAFTECSQLREVSIPSTITSIGDCAFYQSPIGEIVLPEGLTDIGMVAFSHTALKSVVIPDSVTSIGRHAFSGNALTEVKIPGSVTVISDGAFAENRILKTVIMEPGVQNIDGYAFKGCSSLSTLHLPDGLVTIGESAFWLCESLETVDIPGSVVKIGEHAFSSCSSLVNVKIGSGVTDIGSYAFSGCAITSITIPDAVASIGTNPFSGCPNLSEIVVSPENTRLTIMSNALYDSAGQSIISYPCGLSETKCILPQGVKAIEPYAFSECSALTFIELPEGVTVIGEGAFSYCSGLRTIFIPEGVTEIKANVFEECGALDTIRIPESVVSINYWAFNNCSALTGITIPKGVTSIAKNAFQNCTALTLVVERGSYAEEFCAGRGLSYVYSDETDSLSEPE